MRPAPTKQQIAAAFNAGAEVKCGLPTIVPLGGRAWAALDLAAAYRGDHDPWMLIDEPRPGIVDLQSTFDRGLYVDGMPVGGGNRPYVDLALRLAPKEGDEHAAHANEARKKAGEAALRVRDSMVRARLLDLIDGWSAFESNGEVLDEDPDHGLLIRPDPSMEMSCLVLIVVCPSTARKYALRVPEGMRTAKQARLWTFQSEDAPDVET